MIFLYLLPDPEVWGFLPLVIKISKVDQQLEELKTFGILSQFDSILAWKIGLICFERNSWGLGKYLQWAEYAVHYRVNLGNLPASVLVKLLQISED